MIKMTTLNRLILLITAHLAGYMIVSGIEGYDSWAVFYFTIAFGVLVLACLLLMLFGFEVLDNTIVVLVATLIPLSLSSGIIANYFHQYKLTYLIFAIAGLIGILISRIYKSKKIATIVLAAVHGLSGLVITILPLILSLVGTTPLKFTSVGMGGALIGLIGLMLTFLKTRGNKLLVTKSSIYRWFPTLLLIVTALFVIGLNRN